MERGEPGNHRIGKRAGEAEREKQAERRKGGGIRAVTCSDPAHPEHGESRRQAPAASPLSASVIVLPIAQLLAPGLLPAGFSIPSGKSGRAKEEAGRLQLRRRDLGLRGDYQEGWSCVWAVPGSPGPFCHGLTPSSKALHAKPLTFPPRQPSPGETVTPQSHRFPGPAPPWSRLEAQSARGKDHVGLFARNSWLSTAFGHCCPRCRIRRLRESFSPAQHRSWRMRLGRKG